MKSSIPNVDVKTQMRVAKDGVGEVIMRVTFLPRGSGNRYKARKLAEAFTKDKRMGPYVRKVQAGTTSVVVHVQACLGMMEAVNEISAEYRAAKDAEGQLALFGKLGAALG